MKMQEFQVAEEGKDLLELPIGTWILASHGRLYQLDQIEEGRADSGKKYWIEPGSLQPMPPDGLDHWFPALIIPFPPKD